jgi:hypothetical protein
MMTGPGGMMDGLGGTMWGMGVVGLLAVGLLILAIAALVKYRFFAPQRGRDDG